MNSLALRLVERVLSKSDRAHPADAVLREELRKQRGVLPQDATQISRALFAYYRWLGWLDQNQDPAAGISLATELAQRFAREPESFSDAELVQKAVPSWVHNELPVTPELARALQAEPKLWLRTKPGQGRELARRLQNCRILGEAALSDTLAYNGREDLFQRAEFHAGEFEVQDVSSQAVGLLCGPEPGQTWWDACAGEGGKLLHLSDLMRNQGLIWATDRAEWRLRRLKRRAARSKVFNYRTALWDGGAKLPTKTRFDGILIDAPCSGIGTWQRNPHARWTLVPQDITELAQVQLNLLIHAAPSLKPGGKLLYSVCSLANSETVAVVDAFEKEVPGFTRMGLNNPLIPGAQTTETVVLWPQQVGGNGMFVAGWIRAKA